MPLLYVYSIQHCWKSEAEYSRGIPLWVPWYGLGTMNMSLRIFLIVIIALIALGIGLILRHLLVRRLRRTVLDNWLVQTLGAIPIIVPLILAAIPVPILLTNDFTLFTAIWNNIKSQLPIHDSDITSLLWILIQSILIIILGIGFARTVMRLTIRSLERNRVDVNISTLIGRILYILIVLTAVAWLFSVWHVAIDLPIAIIGTLTVAFTFAIQDILKNLFAGFYLLLERPFHIGDQITIGDETKTTSRTGRVEDIEIRATKLRLVSGEQLTVPNALIFSDIVINNTYYPERRVTITITLPQEEYSNGETMNLILSSIKKIDMVHSKPEPIVLLTSYTGSTITLTLRFWIPGGQLATISEVVYTLRTILPKADMNVLESAGDI